MINNFVNRFRRPKVVVQANETTNGATATTADDEELDHQWDRPIEFLLSLISNSVGLGNVWRFPYLAAKNGGGAFLIPYFTLYFLIGAPLYYMELALGQFTSRGPGTGFVLARGWQGVGISMLVNSVLGTLYYNVIIAWALFYFVLSFRKRLLWADCGYWWNTDRCFVPGSVGTTYTLNGTTWNCTESQYNNFTASACQEINSTVKVTASEEFYYRLLLGKSSSFDDFGTPRLYMTLLLLVAWIIICLCIFRGVQTSGKVAYFTAIFPYIVLLVLIIFTATLKGAGEGIKYYIIPRWHLIGDFKIWQAAASQVFFSLSLSTGSLVAYAAANRFENKFFKQMCIVVSCDCFTGVFAGFAVFATIGFLATSLGESVESYAEASGPGLAFITYPEALSRMPASPFFSVIFFMMLLALGLGSQFASTDVTITALMEIFPSYARRRSLLVVIACTVYFICSVPFACPGGIYLFELFQEYTANISLVMVGFFEVVVVAHIYGFNRFLNDVKLMLGKRAAEYYLFVTLCVTAPLLTFIISVMNLLSSTSLKDKASAGFPDYDYPVWSTVLGWLIFASCVIPIPLFFIISYIREYRILAAQKRSGNNVVPVDSEFKPLYLQALTLNNLPSEQWGPRRRANQTGIYAHLNKTIIEKPKSAGRRPRSSKLDLNRRDDEQAVTNTAYEPDLSGQIDDDDNSSRY